MRNFQITRVWALQPSVFILRSDSQHCVSKDGPESEAFGADWSVLRYLPLFAARQDEAVSVEFYA